MTDCTELKRLAEAANEVTGDVNVEMTLASVSGPNQAEIDVVTAFLGMATPAAVLAMIAENESLRGSCKAMGADMGKLTRDRNSFRSKAEKLGAESAGLKTGFQAYEQANAELRAEIKALRVTCAKAHACMDRWADGYAFDTDGPGARIRDELFGAYRPVARAGIAQLHAAMGKGEQS